METNGRSHCSAFCSGFQVTAIPLSRDQGPDKSGHGYLLCFPDGRGQFPPACTCSVGFLLVGKIGFESREEKYWRVLEGVYHCHAVGILLFFGGTIPLCSPRGCRTADPTPWPQWAMWPHGHHSGTLNHQATSFSRGFCKKDVNLECPETIA